LVLLLESAVQADTHRSGGGPERFSDERKLDVVDQLIPLAEDAGLPMTHLATAFTIASRGPRNRPCA
jgi:aryl-alcohol dehydrogenase-like predicted oxidoreductase